MNAADGEARGHWPMQSRNQNVQHSSACGVDQNCFSGRLSLLPNKKLGESAGLAAVLEPLGEDLQLLAEGSQLLAVAGQALELPAEDGELVLQGGHLVLGAGQVAGEVVHFSGLGHHFIL